MSYSKDDSVLPALQKIKNTIEYLEDYIVLLEEKLAEKEKKIEQKDINPKEIKGLIEVLKCLAFGGKNISPNVVYSYTKEDMMNIAGDALKVIKEKEEKHEFGIELD